METANTAPSTNVEQVPGPKEKLCAVCKKAEVDLSTCGRCHGIWYCSTACQRSDWKFHKLLCKAYSESICPQDGKRYVRMIFFHPDKRLPEIQWCDYEECTVCDVLVRQGSPPPNANSRQSTDLLMPMQPRGVVYGYQIQIRRRHQADFVNQGVNQSLAAAFANLGMTAMTAWKSPVLVSRGGATPELRAMPNWQDSFMLSMGVLAEDITMADFRRSVEWMANYRGDDSHFPPTLHLPLALSNVQDLDAMGDDAVNDMMRRSGFAP
ncbi:hypothetical protein Daus18300_006559 [Diaporthe australafricana]|uniref:MYND-type domain-containing protein n=1 Tax=Diaporthe australafricana TaxID=127596 RepID=A0ABR3WT54_9PEZI